MSWTNQSDHNNRTSANEAELANILSAEIMKEINKYIVNDVVKTAERLDIENGKIIPDLSWLF